MTRHAEEARVGEEGDVPECIHKKPWAKCACCRGKFGMLVIDLDILLSRNQPPEVVGNLVAEGIRRMRRGKEELERRGASPK